MLVRSVINSPGKSDENNDINKNSYQINKHLEVSTSGAIKILLFFLQTTSLLNGQLLPSSINNLFVIVSHFTTNAGGIECEFTFTRGENGEIVKFIIFMLVPLIIALFYIILLQIQQTINFIHHLFKRKFLGETSTLSSSLPSSTSTENYASNNFDESISLLSRKEESSRMKIFISDENALKTVKSLLFYIIYLYHMQLVSYTVSLIIICILIENVDLIEI